MSINFLVFYCMCISLDTFMGGHCFVRLLLQDRFWSRKRARVSTPCLADPTAPSGFSRAAVATLFHSSIKSLTTRRTSVAMDVGIRFCYSGVSDLLPRVPEFFGYPEYRIFFTPRPGTSPGTRFGIHCNTRMLPVLLLSLRPPFSGRRSSPAAELPTSSRRPVDVAHRQPDPVALGTAPSDLHRRSRRHLLSPSPGGRGRTSGVTDGGA
uniref:Uncharacterized protein n=1 Tax=Leersia perrieri TaxID=77586 RepID=A0A0D9W815_9ORYZ